MTEQPPHDTHPVGMVWVMNGAVGLVTTFGIDLYGRWVRTGCKG